MDKKVNEWNSSYQRGENFIFYPHDEVVKFINRFIRKRVGKDSFVDIIYNGDFYKSGEGIISTTPPLLDKVYSDNMELKALDFGCGIGRQTMLMNEFNIESYGIDISSNAIDMANSLVKDINSTINFQVYDGEHIPFDDNFFDFSISYGVLDSMPFSLAKKIINEIDRVTKKYFFVTLIGEDSSSLFSNINTLDFTSEIEVVDSHEFGTIQSFFNVEKIQELIRETSFDIKWGQKLQHINILDNSLYSRYFIVLQKE